MFGCSRIGKPQCAVMLLRSDDAFSRWSEELHTAALPLPGNGVMQLSSTDVRLTKLSPLRECVWDSRTLHIV